MQPSISKKLLLKLHKFYSFRNPAIFFLKCLFHSDLTGDFKWKKPCFRKSKGCKNHRIIENITTFKTFNFVLLTPCSWNSDFFISYFQTSSTWSYSEKNLKKSQKKHKIIFIWFFLCFFFKWKTKLLKWNFYSYYFVIIFNLTSLFYAWHFFLFFYFQRQFFLFWLFLFLVLIFHVF